MKERCRQIAFIVLALAFFIVPWIVPALLGSKFIWVRNYAPGAAVIIGIIFAVTVGNPFAKITGKLSSQLLGAAIVLMGFGMNLNKVLSAGHTLCDPMVCSEPGSSVHGIFQARILE